MQFFAGIAYAFGQYRLDEHVNVLCRGVYLKHARFYVGKNAFQSV